MGFGNFSVIELAVMFTILGAFLVFFGLFLMLRRKQSRRNRRRFARKQLVMEEALKDRIKNKRTSRNFGPAEEIKLKEPERADAVERADRVQGSRRAESRTKTAEKNIRSEKNLMTERAKRIEEGRAPEFSGEALSGGKQSGEKQENWNDGSALSRKIQKKPEKKQKENEAAGQIFQENRRISHRRDQLKRLEETAVLK